MGSHLVRSGQGWIREGGERTFDAVTYLDELWCHFLRWGRGGDECHLEVETYRLPFGTDDSEGPLTPLSISASPTPRFYGAAVRPGRGWKLCHLNPSVNDPALLKNI